ncbi:MAG TPA: hypothetical protein VKT21_01820 [Thermoplasmata archaeon]|nr:hypothetical protein [Thermoplasmata archaeon]
MRNETRALSIAIVPYQERSMATTHKRNTEFKKGVGSMSLGIEVTLTDL